MPDQPEPVPERELSFEQALGQLERIVETLERGESDLSSALNQYETSVKLLTHCQRLLDQAEQSVALLSGVDTQGNPISTPFDATATIAREPDPISADISPRAEPKPSQPTRQFARKVRAAPEVDAVDPLDPPF
jgi:exodeoxyribonuclease VII small subunit